MSSNRISVPSLDDGAIVPTTAYQKLFRESFIRMIETGKNFNTVLDQAKSGKRKNYITPSHMCQIVLASRK